MGYGANSALLKAAKKEADGEGASDGKAQGAPVIDAGNALEGIWISQSNSAIG